MRRSWVQALLLLVAAVIVRSPALQGERIWDDDYLVHDNPFIKSPVLILEAFRHYLFLDSLSFHYRPVQNISYIVDYFFWNTNTWGFHLSNVLWHAGGCVLLYFLLRQLFVALLLQPASISVRATTLNRLPQVSALAFLVALVWALHPVHSAAVDYVSGRADSLAFFFACAGWLLFLRGTRTTHNITRGLLYVLAGLAGLFALCSREIALVWLVLFIVYVLSVERAASRRFRATVVISCIALVSIYIGLRQLPGQRLSPSSNEDRSVPVRAVLMARALGDYGRLMIFPSNLHMERTVFDSLAYRSRATWRSEISLEYLSILGLLFLAALVLGSARQGRGQILRIAGASWFFVGYLPVSNIVQLNATVAEHWLYLPSVGLLIFVAGCAVEIPARHRRFITALTLLAASGLGICSYARSTDWVTAETFYRRTLSAGGTSARIGLNLGQIYYRRGDYGQAERIFRKALEIAPDYPLARNNLASALSRQGKTKEAEEVFGQLEKSSMQTRKEYPRTWVGALNLARMRYNAKDYDFAIEVLERARKDYPEVWDLISFESEVLRQTRGPDAALKLIQNFARANWWHHAATLALGRLYAQKDDVDLADAALYRASWLDVHDSEALRLIALMRVRQNRLGEALQTQRRAVARQPDEPRQYDLLSDILEKMGRGEEARAALGEASRLRSFAQSQVVVN